MKTATMLNDLNGGLSSITMEDKVARVVVLGRKGVGKTGKLFNFYVLLICLQLCNRWLFADKSPKRYL